MDEIKLQNALAFVERQLYAWENNLPEKLLHPDTMRDVIMIAYHESRSLRKRAEYDLKRLTAFEVNGVFDSYYAERESAGEEV